MKDKLLYEERQRRCLEDEIVKLKIALNDGNAEHEVSVNFIVIFVEPSTHVMIICGFHSLKGVIEQTIQLDQI